MLHKNVRIALQLQHKDDSVSSNSGTLAFGDYQWDELRYLHHANGNNEWVMFKDAITDKLDQIIKDIINIGGNNPNADPSLIFLYQFDKDGNAYYSDEVNAKWKEWMKVNYRNTKPTIICADYEKLHYEMIPMFHSKCVMTTVRFTGDVKDYDDIGKLTEALIAQFVNQENNITFRVVSLYDKCMKIAHDLHLLDVNQDSKLTGIWSDLADNDAILDEVIKWLNSMGIYQTPSKEYIINLSTSDPGYMYKYSLEEANNNNPNDNIPIFNTSVAAESVKPVQFAELTHTRQGILMDCLFSLGSKTEYTRRDMVDGSWSGSVNGAFAANPQNPTYHMTQKIGDNDNQINKLTGSVVVDYRKDVVTEAYLDMPWMTVEIECYNFNGNLVKTVNATWDKNGSNKLVLEKGMLSGTYTFKASLNGYYSVKTKLRVYWGRFGSWTDEVLLCRWSVARGNNSGGTWKINPYLFNNQSNRILTRCQLHGASKYEKNVIINGKGYGWGGNVNPPITWENNGNFSVPGSADHWDASFFGKIYAKDGCDFICKDYHNVGVSGTRDVKGSTHYPDADKYSILTTANLTVSYTGQKAKYSQDWYNTPSIFAPMTNDCTIMLRGGGTYRVVSQSNHLNCRQVGIYKVEVGTIDIIYKNTKYYGRDLILSRDFILAGKTRGYKFDVVGKAPSVTHIASGVPDIDRSVNTRSMFFMRKNLSPYEIKPETETGMGLISKINLVRKYRLDEVPNKYINIITKENEEIKFKIEYAFEDEWVQLYSDKDNYQRVYAMIVNDTWLYILTYHINVKRINLYNIVGNTLELVLRDSNTGDVTHSFSLMEDKTDNCLPIEYDGRVYYVAISDSSNDDEPVTLYNETDHIVGYLK